MTGVKVFVAAAERAEPDAAARTEKLYGLARHVNNAVSGTIWIGRIQDIIRTKIPYGSKAEAGDGIAPPLSGTSPRPFSILLLARIGILERPHPDEYTQTRAQFGHRAVTVCRTSRDLIEDLIAGYVTLNNMVNPINRGPGNTGNVGTTTSTGGITGTPIEANAELEYRHGHNPHLVRDVIDALDRLIEFTEAAYI